MSSHFDSVRPEEAPSRTKSSRFWLYVVLLFVVGWVGFLAVLSPMYGPDGLPTPRLSQAASGLKVPEYWRLIDLENKPLSFQRFQGKAVFLNIWATWCGPCKIELPSIVNLASNPRLKDVEFLCVSIDEEPADVRAFLKDKKWPMSVYRTAELPVELQTRGIPATFLIAPDGRIAAADVGAAQWDDPSVVDFLEKLSMNVDDDD